MHRFTPAELASALTIEQACKDLRVSRRTMYRLIAEDRIRPVRVGAGRGHWEFPLRLLDDYRARDGKRITDPSGADVVVRHIQVKDGYAGKSDHPPDAQQDDYWPRFLTAAGKARRISVANYSRQPWRKISIDWGEDQPPMAV